MLDKNTLSQLGQLKATIQAEKEYAEGTVAGTNGRFGFVRLDDGRDAFLAPDKMLRVIPGDRVRVSLRTNAQDKLDADLEKLITADLGRFIGTYKVKGAAHFVVPDQPHINRWLFVPPKGRGKIQDGELVTAKLQHHPFQDGKASVQILDVIGKPDQPKIEHKYITAKFDLSRNWSTAAEQQAQQLASLDVVADAQREDLQDLPFITIDGRSTRDMDDAITVAKTDDGWLLQVAIADPASHIAPQSALAITAQQYGQTLYMPGGALSMLPPALATDVFSLVEDSPRPALLCRISLATSGEITAYQFSHCVIRSRAKLNYADVASFIAGENIPAIAPELHAQLRDLHQLAEVRLAYRTQISLVNPDQPDFDFILDDQGKIADIAKREKTWAHRMVEEAMLATNMCAGEFLAQQNKGIFAVHAGFREDRIGEVRALLKEEMPELDTSAINNLCEHIALIKLLDQDNTHKCLLGPLRRMMSGSELSVDPAPHLGLGISHYATITSPIRRYADLYNHWAIRDALYGEQLPAIDEKSLAALQEAVSSARQASRQLEQWLVCQYLKNNKGMQGLARIRIVTPKGFGARFEHNGIDGFVNFDKKTEKSFDAKRMTLTVGDKVYRIDDTLEVKVSGVELEKRRVRFEMVEQSSKL